MAKRRWLVTLCICILVLFGLAAYKYTQIKAAIAFGESFPEPSASVEAATVQKSFTKNTINTIGEIIAPRTIDLRNELAGRIAVINVESGHSVKKGDVLLQLDIAEENARLKAAQANVNLAELELQRVQKLLKNKTVSQDSVDQSQAKFDIARANVNELVAIIAKKTLKAPFDAIAGLHEFDPGEYIESNTHIVTLVGITDFSWVDFNVPLGQTSLNIGSEIQVTLPSLNNKQVEALVIAKDSIISVASRNLRYRAKIFTNHTIPANSIVRIAIPSAPKAIFQVPAIALLKDGLGSYVFILAPENSGKNYRAQRRSVIIDSQNEQSIAILKGLNAGDLIATHGAFKLRHNLLTYIKERLKDSDDQQAITQ